MGLDDVGQGEITERGGFRRAWVGDDFQGSEWKMLPNVWEVQQVRSQHSRPVQVTRELGLLVLEFSNREVS